MPKNAADNAEFEHHKDTIHQLYINEDKPLKDVIEIMTVAHNFQKTYVPSTP